MTWRYTLPTHPHEREVSSGLLWAAGAQGVWEQAEALVGWFTEQTDAVPTGGTWEPEPDVDHQAAWKATMEPVIAGPVAVVPTWLADAWERPAATETVVVVDPGQAFGSGHHATTTLCTEALAELDLEGLTVLDVGTGTGVLAIVAALRGAARVVGVDIDPHAVEIARENVAANGLAVAALGEVDAGGRTIELGTGSADATSEVFDVVVANLVTDVISALADELAARVAPGGLLITSGIDAQRAAKPAARLAAAGLDQRASRVRDGWVGAVWSRPSP